MIGGDGRWRGPPGRSWALRCCIWLSVLLLCLLATLPAHGQTPSTSSPSAPTDDWQTLSDLLTRLEARLTERQNQIASLQGSLSVAEQALAELESQYARSRILQERLQTALSETSTSLRQSSQSLADLSAAFDQYRSESQARVATLERQARGWRIGAAVAGLTAVVGWLLVALR